jgi:hypothetical protein
MKFSKLLVFICVLLLVSACASKKETIKSKALVVYNPCKTETSCKVFIEDEVYKLKDMHKVQADVLKAIINHKDMSINCATTDNDLDDYYLNLINKKYKEKIHIKGYPVWFFAKLRSEKQYLCHVKTDEEKSQLIECRVFPHTDETIPSGWFKPETVSFLTVFHNKIRDWATNCKKGKPCIYNSCYPAGFYND